MANTYFSRRNYRSRLAKAESKRFARQTTFILITTLVLIGALVVFGIPALIKLAIFFGDIRSSSTPIEASDTIPPVTPQLTTVPTATNSARINLQGFAEAGSQVKLYHNSSQTEETITDTNGAFEFLGVSLRAGVNTFQVDATDQAGNTSQRSSSQTVTHDAKAPEISITSPADGQRFFGSDERLVTIQGTTDRDAQMRINDRTLVVSGDGSFSTQYELEEGENQLLFVAEDAATNITEKTITVTFSD